MAKIAFDVDDTIWKIIRVNHEGNCNCGGLGHVAYRQVPDFDIIQVLLWFVNNGDEVFVWSAGGVSYAQMIVDKLGLTDMVKVIPKISSGRDLKKRYEGIDIAFDDCEALLGKVDIRVKREPRGESPKMLPTSGSKIREV